MRRRVVPGQLVCASGCTGPGYRKRSPEDPVTGILASPPFGLRSHGANFCAPCRRQSVPRPRVFFTLRAGDASAMLTLRRLAFFRSRGGRMACAALRLMRRLVRVFGVANEQ